MMRRLAMPFVATLVTACTQTQTIEPDLPHKDPPAPMPEPKPPTDTELVYEHYGECRRVPSADAIPCPASGPTGILPNPQSIETDSSTVRIVIGPLTCSRSFHMDCPPGAYCNPPPPQPAECPPALRPKLAPGVKPTKTEGARCWYGRVEVVCP
jgi:hypothetical protein